MNESKMILNVHGRMGKSSRLPPSGEVPWKINLRLQSGVADCCYFGPRKQVIWREWKYDHQAPKLIRLYPCTAKHSLTPLQFAWLRKKAAMGQDCGVIYATMKEGCIYVPIEEIEDGKDIEQQFFISQMVSRDKMADWLLEQAGWPERK